MSEVEQLTPERLKELQAEASARGNVLVGFKGAFAQMPIAQVNEAVATLAAMGRQHRRRVLESIERCIKETMERAQSGEITELECAGLATDICLWFANEVRCGREKRYWHDVEDPRLFGKKLNA